MVDLGLLNDPSVHLQASSYAPDCGWSQALCPIMMASSQCARFHMVVNILQLDNNIDTVDKVLRNGH